MLALYEINTRWLELGVHFLGGGDGMPTMTSESVLV